MYRRIIVATVIALSCVLISCSDQHDQVESITDRAKTPRLRAFDVSSVVSDSGVTRYRMNAKEWLIYDQAEEPYWEFPQGIWVEKFNPDLKVDAEIRSKYAIYYERQKLWDLRDSVHAMNLQGEQFECDQLFWDEKMEKVYSDTRIKITQQGNREIMGEGFESNQQLTRYMIRRPIGTIHVNESE